MRQDGSLPRSGGSHRAVAELPEPELVAPVVLAWFGKCSRAGDWAVPEEIRAVACFGDVNLDFTEARLPSSGTVEVDALALFGKLRLIVPAGTDVDLDDTRAVFGQVRQRRARETGRRRLGGAGPGAGGDPDEEPLLLRVTGRALFGKVVVEHR